MKIENKHYMSSSWDAAATMMSSIYAATPVNPVSMASIVCWNMASAGLTQKLTWLNLNKPFDSFSTSSWKKVSRRSIFVKKIIPFNLVKRSSGTVNGY